MVSQPNARELPGTFERVTNSSAVSLTISTRASGQHLQQVPRLVADSHSRPEQTGMTCDTSKRPGVLVVHFTDENPSAPGVVVRRRGAPMP